MNKTITPPRKLNWWNRVRKMNRHGDTPWKSTLVVVSSMVLFLVVAIGWMLWRDSAETRYIFGWDFILPTSTPNWDPVNERFNAWPFIYGTLVTSLTAMIIALPISLGIAIYLAEVCPEWLKHPLNWLVELLAAIPSVIFGLWGLFVFLPQVVTPIGNLLIRTLSWIPILGAFFTGPMPASGATRLGAAFILTIMIIPTISAVSRDVLRAIPNSQREAAMALGSTQWEAIWHILLPYGISGILGAVILGLGRALGETMAVTMVIGNNATEPTGSLLRPGYTMASVIANEFAEAVSTTHSQVLVEVGLVLFFITLILNSIARLLVWRVASRIPQETR
jgi:phosphate transport system permease protein